MCKLVNLGVNESQLSHEGFPMDDALVVITLYLHC